MKYGKIIQGNVTITINSKDDFSEVVEITGSLDIRSEAKLPQLQTVGGSLYIWSEAKLPQLQTVGGYLDIRSGAKLTAPQLQTVGGSLDIWSEAKLTAPQLQTVGGYLDIRSGAKLTAPQLQTVGGYFDINSGAKLTTHENIKYFQPQARQIALSFTFNCFFKLGFLWADDILGSIISKKQDKGNTIYKIRILGQSKISYCIEVDGIYSHGDTIKEAKESLKYKISNRDTSQYKDYTLDTVIKFENAISMYRTITGACESGTRHFCENILKDKREKYTVKEIIELTEGQYNNDKLREFFNYKMDTMDSRGN